MENNQTIKLQKYFSLCGVMSRRQAEEEILAGKVLLNGSIARITDRITPSVDRVEYKGKRILPLNEEKLYILLNKPRGYICSLKDERGRRCAVSLVRKLTDRRVWTVGRLDCDSDGLIIVTNDGELTNLLTHPRHEIPKVYAVRIEGALSEEAHAKLSSPLVLDGYPILPVKVRVISRDTDSTLIEMVLYEGRNRQIRKMCEMCSLKILSLTRTAIGDLTLNGLPCGECRHLETAEVQKLYGGHHA